MKSGLRNTLGGLALFLIANAFFIPMSVCHAEGISTLTIDGEALKEIRKVTLRPDGRVMIVYGGSGGQYPTEKLPAEFLTSWGITVSNIAAAKKDDFENALNQGKFRCVGGTVFDLRQKQPSWTSFQNVKLLQKLSGGGALVDPNPDQISINVIHVINLPDNISDTDRFSFAAKQTGTYSYENQRGNERVVRSYDAGRICSRNEIPDAILKEGKLFADLPMESAPRRDVLSALPQSDSLLCNGTGFFITEDGYLITNDHVVRGVKHIKVRQQSENYDADVIKTDQVADLALLKVKGDKFSPLPLLTSKDISLGDSVFTIGFPNVDLQGIEPKFTDGRISSLAGLHDDPSEYQVSVPVQPGNSGGPLINSDGQVVGVIVARINDFAVLRSSGSIPQNINYAIKASVLRDFLKSAEDKSHVLKFSSSSANRDAIIKQSQSGIVMVLGYK